MAKNRRLKYRIYRLDLSKMIYHFFVSNKDRKNGFVLGKMAFAHSKTSGLEDDHLQDDCALFYQVLLEKNNANGEEDANKIVKKIYEDAIEKDGVIEDLSHSLVYVNFGEMLNKIDSSGNAYYKKIVETLLDPVNGGFSIEFENGETVHFVSFFKSNSMSKKKVLSFVDKQYRDKLIERSLLGLKVKEKKLSLSRYYAYTGLSMSGGIRLDIEKEFKGLGRLELNENRVLVVKDYKKDPSKTFIRPLITMASKKIINDVIKNILYIRTFLLLNDGHELKDEEILIIFNEKFRKKCKEIRGWINPKARSKERYESYLDFYNNYQLEDIKNLLIAFGVKELPDSLPLEKDNLDKFISQYINDNYLSIFTIKNGGYEDLGKYAERLISLLCGNIVIESNQVKSVLLLTSINQSSDQFDGEGLLSPRYSEIINRLYTDPKHLKNGEKHTSFQIRLPLIKGMLHTVDFKSFYEEECMQRYFKDINNENIECDKGLYYEIAPDKKGVRVLLNAIIIDGSKYLLDELSKKYRKLEDIEIILTTGQVKNEKITTKTEEYEKDFMKAYFDAFNKYHHSLYITGSDSIEHKKEKETELNYQFLSTAGLGRKEAEVITNKQKERIEKLYAGDYETIKDLFELNKGEEMVDFDVPELLRSLISEEEDEELNSQIYEGRKYPALKYNENLKYTNAVRSEISDLIFKEIKQISIGHIKLQGELRYLSGDLLVLLYTIVGGKDDDLDPKEKLQKYSFYAPKGNFYQNDNSPMECVLLRNPHISKNENTVAKPWVPFDGSLREKYFKDLDFVCMIDGTSLIQERLGGADYDGDEVRIISDSLFVNAVKQDKNSDKANFEERKHLGIVPIQYETAIVPSIDSSNPNGESINDGKAIYFSLYNTFGSKVGLYSNDGFKAACVAYSDEHIGDFEHERKVVEYYLTVGLEVDSAKSGTKPQKPKQLIAVNDPVFASADRFLRIKDALTSDAKDGNKEISNHLSHDSNAVLVLDEIGANLIKNNKIYSKDEEKLKSVMALPEEDSNLTNKIKGFVSYYNFMTSSFNRKSCCDSQSITDLLNLIIKQNYYPVDSGEIMQELYYFIADYSYRLDDEKIDFAKIAILTDREAREEIKRLFKLDDDEALACISPIETLSKHQNGMSKVFSLVYFLYSTTKKLEEEHKENNDKEKEIDDEDVKEFAVELNDTITKQYKRGVYTRRENKDSILKLGVLKKHIAKLFDNNDLEALRYIFMLDTKYANKIPSWLLWDLYSKELSEIAKRGK